MLVRMSTREERARARRATWDADVVEPGTPKPRLYDELTPMERLCALSELNERAWRAAGNPMPAPLPRARWPGEIFEIPSRG
jgi:hypothetical protein